MTKKNTFLLSILLLAVAAAVSIKYLHPAQSLKDKSWTVFENYLTAAKNHDLPALTSISYQISDTCKDASKREDCYALMDNVYKIGAFFRESDMTHIAYDDKQIILSSDYREEASGNPASSLRFVIYFVRAGDVIKFLSFDPFQGSFLVRTPDMATSTVVAKLESLIKDSDGDMIPDSEEDCTDASSDKSCIKTDPNNKDTNGNGWWDSTERLFYSSSSTRR